MKHCRRNQETTAHKEYTICKLLRRLMSITISPIVGYRYIMYHV